MNRTAGVRSLEGTGALITGTGCAPGRALALAFAASGADVVITERRRDRGERLAAEIRARTGRRALVVATRVGSWSSVTQVADVARDALGRVDVLVNNTRLAPIYPSLAEVEPALGERRLDVSVAGAFRLTALVGARMAEGSGGTIVNVGWGSRVPTRDRLRAEAEGALFATLAHELAAAYGPTVRIDGVTGLLSRDLDAVVATALRLACDGSGSSVDPPVDQSMAPIPCHNSL